MKRAESVVFIKGSPAHQAALNRMGFNPSHKLRPVDEKGNLLLVKAVQNGDLPAFIALIAEGIDINYKKEGGAGWTCLHWLFSEANKRSICRELDYIHIASENMEVNFINILIKNGAVPLKDTYERTPLMYLKCGRSFTGNYNDQLIQLYSDFEANYHNFDPQEYREQLCALRECEYRFPIEAFGHDTIPDSAIFKEFWRSLETHSKVNYRRIQFMADPVSPLDQTLL